MDTPEFLIWALEYSCPIRGFQDGSDPERTERQLRSARAVSDARREGRVFEGCCVDPPHGFRIDDALAIYGGKAAVEHECGECPANPDLKSRAGSFAGCFGLLPLPANATLIHAAIEEAIERRGGANDYEQLFLPTVPRWYGLWAHSTLGPAQSSYVAQLVAELDLTQPIGAEFEEFIAALNVSIHARLPLHAVLYPGGHVEGTAWRLVPHCPRCKAAWPALQSQHCGVCGYAGHAAPEKKRKARGKRPYRTLASVLGEKAASEFLVRYAAFRGQPGWPERPQTPPRAVPQGNLQAG